MHFVDKPPDAYYKEAGDGHSSKSLLSDLFIDTWKGLDSQVGIAWRIGNSWR